jgi:AsmA protein
MTDPTLPRQRTANPRDAARVRPIGPDGRPIPMRVPRREPPRRRSSWLAVAGYAALSVGCMLAGAVTFLLVAAPVDLVRDRAVEVVKARTGRDLAIAGATKLTYFPRFGVAFSQVSLGAPADMGGPPVLAARSLQVELPVWSLFSRRVVPRQVRLDGPVIELRVDAQGRRSWDFAAWHGRPVRLAQAGGRANDAGLESTPSSGGGRGRLLPASSVRIVDATVRYVDERSGTSQELTGLDADLTADDASNSLDAKGSLTWTGEKLGFEAKLSPADTQLGRGTAKLALRIAGRPIEATYDGTVGLGREFGADGTVNLRAVSWADLVQWVGKQRVAAAETGALAVSVRVAAADRRVALDDLSATLGENSLTGSLAVETGGVRPHVSGRLQLSELDFGRLLVRPARSGPAVGGGATTDPIGDLLQGKGGDPTKSPQVRGFTKRSGTKGWSDEIIDLAPLGLADADLKLSVDRLVYKNVTTGQSRLALALQDRVAKITLEDVQLYSGRARGLLTLDGRGQVAATAVNVALDEVSALTLLTDALEFGWLDGRGTIAVALAGQGQSERQIVESLRGKVELTVTNGAIVGVDVGRMLGGIEKGRFSGLRTSPEDKTPFSEFSGSFVIANGVAQNQDLKLVSPHLQVSGSGSANLAQRQVDYIVRPKVAASHNGDGSVVSLAGLEVPVHVEGPWEKPTFTPDVKAVLGSEQAGEAIKQIGKNLKSQEVQDAIRGLMGGGDGQQKVKPRELLEKLLKKD